MKRKESNNDNNLRLIMVKTNRSTLHTVYNIQQSATQGSNDTTHRLSRRTAATTRFSPEGIGCQKQTAPRYCQHPIRWAFTSQAFTRWRHLSTHPINRPVTHLSTLEGWKAELASITTRSSLEGIGCQKQMAPRRCQHLIRWAFM